MQAKAGELSRKLFGTLAEEADQKLRKTLLDHQYKRILQITYRRELFRQRGGGFNVLLSMIDSAKILAEQKVQLKQQLSEVQARYNKDLEKLRASTQERVPEMFPKEVRERMKQAFGDFGLFELDNLPG